MAGSIVSITGLAATSGSTNCVMTAPSGIQNGDLGVLLLHWNTGTGTMGSPSGPSGAWGEVERRGGLGGSNCYSLLATKTLSTSDSSGSIGATYTGSAPHYCLILAILRGFSLDITPVGYSDDTADTSLVYGSFTPVTASDTVILMTGITTTATQGVFSVTTPPAIGATSFTTDVNANGNFATGANTGIWGGHLTLSGGAGVSQSIGNGTADKNLRHNSWVIPLKTAGSASAWRVKTASGYTQLNAPLVKS